MAVVNAQAASAMTTVNFINTVGFDANRTAVTVSFSYQSLDPTTGAELNNTITVPFLTIVPIPYLQVRIVTRSCAGHAAAGVTVTLMSRFPQIDAEYAFDAVRAGVSMDFDREREARDVVRMPSDLSAPSGCPALACASIDCHCASVPQIDEVTVEFNAKINSVTTSESTALQEAKVDASASGAAFGFQFSVSASYSNQKTEKKSNNEQREFSMKVFVKASQSGMPAGMSRVMSMLESAIMTKTVASVAAA